MMEDVTREIVKAEHPKYKTEKEDQAYTIGFVDGYEQAKNDRKQRTYTFLPKKWLKKRRSDGN